MTRKEIRKEIVSQFDAFEEFHSLFDLIDMNLQSYPLDARRAKKDLKNDFVEIVEILIEKYVDDRVQDLRARQEAFKPKLMELKSALEKFTSQIDELI